MEKVVYLLIDHDGKIFNYVKEENKQVGNYVIKGTINGMLLKVSMDDKELEELKQRLEDKWN